MTYLNRRYQVVAILAIFVVTTLYTLTRHFQIQISGSSLTFPSKSPTSKVYIPPDDGKWHWRQLEQHNPLTSYFNLPKGTTKLLPKVQHDFSTELQAFREKREMRQDRVKQ